jgi:hypothetical protein
LGPLFPLLSFQQFSVSSNAFPTNSSNQPPDTFS